MDDLVVSIEPCKLADIVVIDGDLAATSAEQLASLGVWITVLGGRVVFAADPALAAMTT